MERTAGDSHDHVMKRDGCTLVMPISQEDEQMLRNHKGKRRKRNRGQGKRTAIAASLTFNLAGI